MNKTIAFNQKRNEFKTKVLNNKKGITLKNDFLLEKFIKRTYKGDSNYLKREINYGQVEFSFPKYSFREKTFFGSIFSSIIIFELSSILPFSSMFQANETLSR